MCSDAMVAVAKSPQNEEALTLVENLNPSVFTFYRTVMGRGKRIEEPIFGSVSKRDIADRIREAVNHVDETAAIRLDESNVEVFEGRSLEQPLRIIKATGQFTVVIGYPETSRKVYRDIVVRPDDPERKEAPSG
jgi:ribosomal protein L9